ncbi:MAG TPA: hypothetical protein PKY82_14625 [Pyrinomonadaceae bacterium]|nr:hypothetical protein [Pyrinomonadaceae bacterium]
MTNSLKVLLSEIIDYAGLFPPSQVTMATAVSNFDRYLKSEHAWMLGRFIVPVSRLDEFSYEAETFLDGKNPWRLSVLATDDLQETLDLVAEFNLEYEGRAKIDTIEIKVEKAAEINEAAKILPRELTAYFEIPPNDILADFITALAITRKGAKLRTGGVTTDAFPSTDAIIKFMRVCVAANVPFKATAGLHHPIRGTKPLTYEPNAPIGTMHGFFNLFLSACFLRQDLNNLFVHRIMNENESENIQFEEDRISWMDQNLSMLTVTLTRQKNAISFGSCSFLEPIEDLQGIGLL